MATVERIMLVKINVLSFFKASASGHGKHLHLHNGPALPPEITILFTIDCLPK